MQYIFPQRRVRATLYRRNSHRENMNDSEHIYILLVAENTTDVIMLERALEGIHTPECTIVHETSLDQALQQLDYQHIDIILIDLAILESKDLSTLESTHSRIPGVPIIVLTESDAEIRAIQAVRAGAHDYLVKGHVEPKQIVHTLHCAIRHQQMRDAVEQSQQELQASETRFRNIIARNADGIVVVDYLGTVRMVNPAAETLFGRTTEEVVGKVFGFPLVSGETTEIDILNKHMQACIAEMRVVDIEWDGDTAYLISLRDISEHYRIREALREAEQFSYSILNAITAHIAVINEQGEILVVNDSWNQFARDNGDVSLEHTSVGTNYFNVCLQADHEKATEAFISLEGILSVLNGERDQFELEYPCHSPQDERWFLMRVQPLRGTKQRGLVISHTDITVRKRAARAEVQAEHNAKLVEELKRELQSLRQLSHPVQNAITAGLFGTAPLHDSASQKFETFIQTYDTIIEKAIERRSFKVEHNVSQELRLMAEQLGFLRAGPRDVVEIHSTVLREKTKDAHPMRAQVYVEEGRLIVLELMGYLVSYYRSFAFGVSNTSVWQNYTSDIDTASRQSGGDNE